MGSVNLKVLRKNLYTDKLTLICKEVFYEQARFMGQRSKF